MALWPLLVLADTLVYSGLKQALKVSPPRVEAEIQVDGVLSEPVWQVAARLTDFSQYSPTDGLPAVEETEVLVWYSPTAIHLGVRAHAEPGTVLAHLTDRDAGIMPDDYVEFQIGTYNNGRHVYVFAVNPLGVQADGALVEGAQTQTGGLGQPKQNGREQADLSPDYVFDSKGRITDYGYEIEIRIPFRSLRYRVTESQDWSFQVIRKTAHNGHEDTWTPTKRAASSFVAQAGTLSGLNGIRRGQIFELNPIVTSTVTGGPGSAPARWDYRGGSPVFGGNVKWGVSTNVTLNGTVKPDFSQVESDAGQVQPDPRSAVYFAEKRPFFLDGLENFSTPSQVIYTRRIAAPITAAKVTGRAAGFTFGALSAVDGSEASATGLDHPLYNLLRVQHDLGAQSRVGMAYTDRIEGGNYNRVGEVDARLVFGGVNTLSMNAAVSRTRLNGSATTAPLWYLNFVNNGPRFGLSATVRGIDPDFQAASGFISRGNLAQLNLTPSLTFYGSRGALIERFIASPGFDWIWVYNDLFAGGSALERKVHLNTTWTLRGGWTLGFSLLLERFGFDQHLYADYAVARPTATGVDTIPYANLPSIYNVDWLLSVSSPVVHGFQLSGYGVVGHDENFYEWSGASIWFGQLGLTYRPNQKLRFEANFPFQAYNRRSDDSFVGNHFIPRLKVEYQVSRAVFLRVVGQYDTQKTDSLRDDSRSNAPLLIKDANGVYQRAAATSSNDLQLNFLFSYQPIPGTVFFAGYGMIGTDPEQFAFRRIARQQDAFFTKLSYLFRF
jgi:hypothetical protein